MNFKITAITSFPKKEVAAAILKITNTTRCKGVEKVQKCVANMNFSFFSFLYYPDLTLLWLHMVEATIRDLRGCSG